MIRIPRSRQGPTDTGQGGWTSAHFTRSIRERFGVDQDIALTVAIRSPIPLDTDLLVEADGAGWVLVDPASPKPVLQAAVWEPAFAATTPVTITAAEAARGRFPISRHQHPVPVCFSCGLHDESMRAHAGPLGDGRFATDWQAPEWSVGADGSVDEAALWAAMDCTAAWYVGCTAVEYAAYRASFTVQLAVEVLQPIQPGERYALVAWSGAYEPAWDGRKRGASAAAFASDGTLVAHADTFWVAT